MTAERIHQYFGPSLRHPQACVELTVPKQDGMYTLTDIAGHFARAGISFYSSVPETPLGHAEAIGRLACAMLTVSEDSSVTFGTEEATDWVCLSCTPPPAAARALVNAWRALDLCRNGAPDGAELARLAIPGRHGRLASCTLLRSAAHLGLDTATVSRVADVFQIGQGASGRLFHGTSNDSDGFPGERITADKRATVEFLQRAGLPTTRAQSAASLTQAMEAVERIGFPCVVKPAFGAFGKGVSTRLSRKDQIGQAVESAAREVGFPVIIENHVEGDDHRVTVTRNGLLWVYRRSPAHVIGDGNATLTQLIERENARRARAPLTERAMIKTLSCGEDTSDYVHERYGLSLDAVVAHGVRIDLAGQANIARGGTLEDVGAQVHPDNRRLFETIARRLRSGMIGLDYITPDISKSWRSVPSAVIEINATPGIGGLRDGCAYLRDLFPNATDGRVPTIVVCGDANYRRSVIGVLAESFGRRGITPAICPYAAPADDRNLPLFSVLGWPSVEQAVADVETRAIIVAADPRFLSERGFPVQACDAVIAQPGTADPLVYPIPCNALNLDDSAGLEDAIETVCASYSRPPSPLPHLEITERDEGSSTATVRVWRPRPYPRAAFWRGWPGSSRSELHGIDAADIVGALEALLRQEAERHGIDPKMIGFEMLDGDSAFGPPALRAGFRLGSHGAIGACLTGVVDAVNARLGALATGGIDAQSG